MTQTSELLRASERSGVAQLGLFDGMLSDVREFARACAEAIPERLRPGHARSFCATAIQQYWRRAHGRRGWKLRSVPGTQPELRQDSVDIAVALGDSAAALDVNAASYLIGSTYATMLPAAIRARQGVFYTPPLLVDRLLDAVENAGIDWTSAHVLDPACGGGAFLGPVAARMVTHLKGCNRRVVTRNILTRLRGYEVDPFAAWMSQVFMEATLHTMLDGAGKDIQSVIDVCDSLQRRDLANFDLVVGNPPYGRIKLPPDQREVFRRSLFGHANLYGVFMDLAVRKTRARGGIIGYVTPTSMLSGEYFKRLRSLLAVEANPVSLDLVEERTGIFDGALQETLLAVYRRGETKRNPKVQFIGASETTLNSNPGEQLELPSAVEAPWILPRSSSAIALAKCMSTMTTRLVDWGYKVSTGPLVWNRHKAQLRSRPGRGTVPLVWAESVSADGTFSFRASRRNHLPYFLIKEGDDWLCIKRSCVLLQRTTSKEQPRRLIAAELPESFIAEYGAVTVENHLNMLVPLVASPPVTPSFIAAFLNSAIADKAFRCISGSVAVSAYELEALPLPSLDEVSRMAQRLARCMNRADADAAYAEAYGLS